MFKSNNGMSRALVRRETIAGYLFLLPSLFFFVTFVLYPMFMCIYTSLFDSNMGKNAVDVFGWIIIRSFSMMSSSSAR